MMRTWHKVLLFELAVVVLTIFGIFGYVSGNSVNLGNVWWIVLSALAFAYLFRTIVEIYLSVIILLGSRAKILPNQDFSKGIPADHKAVIAYCVKAHNLEAVARACESIEISLRGNRDANLFFIYLSGAEDPELVRQELEAVGQLQQVFGRDQVLYFHRRTNWGKKWGAYQDLMVWLHHGNAYPLAYVSESYGRYRRDSAQSFFSLELMAESSRGPLLAPEEIASGVVGETARLDPKRGYPVEYLLISDVDVVWPAGSALRIVAKMAHKANDPFVIFQPAIAPRNATATLYTRIVDWGRGLSEYAELALWKIYDSYTFLGKGGVKILPYLEVMIQRDQEVLPPATLSHDFIEARYLRTAYLPDVQILEDVPTNYLEDRKRLQRWVIGHLLGIWQEVLAPLIQRGKILLMRTTSYESRPKPLKICSRLVMRLVYRFEFSSLAFASFLLLALVGGYMHGTYQIIHPAAELTIMSLMSAGILIVPRTAAQMAAQRHLKGHNAQPAFVALVPALAELVLGMLLFLQQLVDQNVALVKGVLAIWRAKVSQIELRWETSLEQRVPIERLSFWAIYERRAVITTLGLGFLLLLLFTEPLSQVWYAAPIWLSFLLGPGLDQAHRGRWPELYH